MSENEDQFAEVYLGLRSQILNTSPMRFEPSAALPNIWGMLVEFWATKAIVTMACLVDTTTSLYFSNGGGIIGGGKHEPVANAARELMILTENFLGIMEPVNEFSFPPQGTMQFCILTYSGNYIKQGDQQSLIDGNSNLSPLFNAANEVITQIRLHPPQK